MDKDTVWLAQRHIQTGFEQLQGWGIHNFPEQPPVAHYSHNKDFFPPVSNLTYSQLKATTCPFK